MKRLFALVLVAVIAMSAFHMTASAAMSEGSYNYKPWVAHLNFSNAKTVVMSFAWTGGGKVAVSGTSVIMKANYHNAPTQSFNLGGSAGSNGTVTFTKTTPNQLYDFKSASAKYTLVKTGMVFTTLDAYR